MVGSPPDLVSGPAVGGEAGAPFGASAGELSRSPKTLAGSNPGVNERRLTGGQRCKTDLASVGRGAEKFTESSVNHAQLYSPCLQTEHWRWSASVTPDLSPSLLGSHAFSRSLFLFSFVFSVMLLLLSVFFHGSLSQLSLHFLLQNP